MYHPDDLNNALFFQGYVLEVSPRWEQGTGSSSWANGQQSCPSMTSSQQCLPIGPTLIYTDQDRFYTTAYTILNYLTQAFFSNLVTLSPLLIMLSSHWV